MRLVLAHLREEEAAALLQAHARLRGVGSCLYRDWVDIYLSHQLVPVKRAEYESHFQNCLVCIDAIENARFLRAIKKAQISWGRS